jgi:hypothetical protein
MASEPIHTGSQNLTGYRQQTPEAVATVNQIKALERDVAELWCRIQKNADVPADPRLLAVAKTQFETAFMYLTRAVFQPEDPFAGGSVKTADEILKDAGHTPPWGDPR